MTPTTGIRRKTAAVCLVAAPLLLVAGTAVAPWNNGTTEEMLATAAGNGGRMMAGDLLAFIALLAFLPAILAVMRSLRRPAPGLAVIGGTLAFTGYAASMGLVASDGWILGLGRQAGGRDVAVAAFDDVGWIQAVIFGVFLLGHALGLILLGGGLLRARVVPVWAATAVIATPIVEILGFAAADSKAVVLVSGALLTAGFGALGLRVAVTGDAAWDAAELAPLGGTAPAAVAV